MDMILFLSAPGHLLLGENLCGETMKGMGLYDTGRMPWWAQSDLLFTNAHEFVGVVLYAGKTDAHTARKVAEVSDHRLVRYFSNAQAMELPRYRGLIGSDVSVLELRWCALEPDRQQVAQLNDEWYYRSPNPTLDESPCAWGYSGIEDVLANRPLIVPTEHY